MTKTQEDIVPATKIPCEEFDTRMGVLGFKIAGNQALEFDLEKQYDGVSASVVNVQETTEGSAVSIAEKASVVIEKIEPIKDLYELKNENGVIPIVGEKAEAFVEMVKDTCEKGFTSDVGEKVEAFLELVEHEVVSCDSSIREKAETVEKLTEDKLEGEGGGTYLVGQVVETLENKGSVAYGSVPTLVNGCVPTLVNGSDDKLPNGQENEFRVGDFVWGKIRNHPWWPGQIYDPRDASDLSVKHSFSENNRLLVAFMGDRSCAWCLPTQLLPFIENFEENSKGCSTRLFHNSVQMALKEIGRNLELELVCKCVPEEHRFGLVRPLLDNIGVKETVLRPNIKVPKISVTEYEAYDVLCKLRFYAENGSSNNGLEVTVLRSWISGFYRSKCGHSLPVYHEPVIIEGLEDKSNMVVENSSAQSKVPFAGPLDDDESPLKLLGSTNGKLHIRKRKSVAKLMEKSTKEGSEVRMTVSSLKKKKTEKQSIQNESGGKSKKRKVEDVKSSELTNGNAVEGVKEEGASLKKQKTVVFSGAETNSTDANEESEIVTSPRERKPSKYLSFPFTGLTGRTSSVHSKSDKIAKKPRIGKKAFKENLPGFDMEENVDGSSVNAISHETVFPLYDVSMPADEFLSEITLAAVDPKSLKNEDTIDLIRDFASARRSSTYLNVEQFGTFKRCKKGEKTHSQVDGSFKDELETDAKSVTKKLELMTEILGRHSSDFSSEEKLKIKEAMKNLVQTVDSVGNMVEATCEKVKYSTENGFSS